ncbi:probable WRKY transcription factor 69 [Salvia splendens]|uniref:probable WRKY transcription factor 69 n=1 Tax=Salvia splendens TaxID=180675 RepID=UPI001C271C77|nr:probable WRKY transcription factor 69 [Salvia splendens]
MQESDDQLSAADHTHASKKRKMGERVVVAVKIEGNSKKQQRNEGPPSDCWSWRKYGQKPIKGSPYPRGYYRCSTSKGCSAKKQVERCKTDASMLLITYTSTHNHPDPAPFSIPTNHSLIHQQEQESETNPDEIEAPPPNSGEHLQFPQSPPPNSGGGNPFEEILQTTGVSYEDDDLGCEVLKSEENDFYDELEELPTSSFFTAFMKSGFCEERIAVNLS